MTWVLDSVPSVDSLAALLTAEAQFQGNGPLKAALTTAWRGDNMQNADLHNNTFS